MLNMLLVTLREGIEMFLIVAIAATYLRKTGREALLPAVGWGAAAAIAASLVLGTWLAEVAVIPLWEGVLALIAAVLVISMVIYMLKAAKHLRHEIGARLEAAAGRTDGAAWLGVFLFVVLMITREGMETAFIMASLFRQTDAAHFAAGALGGLTLAAALAWAWMRYGQRVNLPLFFKVTSAFLILFALQLLVYAFHEATEANALPIDNAYWHVATEPYGPEGEYGALLTYALVLIPAAWLVIAALKNRLARPAQSRA
ncbi:MAG TPA: FTR1 family protein [Burkholderiales bacterium]|jgi:high-affinity iron transporter|nr:FTR1 family protein [Burkholderiales bacterium]HXJ09898.1 FTR1 family protein [Burkholderiales bacterium]